jgi:hypothetical protein
MKLIRIAAVVMLGLSTAACGDDGGGGGGGQCAGIAKLTASPSATPTQVSVGDTLTITVPVNASTTRIGIQLLSDVDGAGYGDGTAGASGAGDVDVEVDVAADAPAGSLFPFVQVYECGKVDVSTQYAPDLTTGAYLEHRSDEPASSNPTSFVAPEITVQ